MKSMKISSKSYSLPSRKSIMSWLWMRALGVRILQSQKKLHSSCWMQFRKANMEPSMHFRKANTELSVHFLMSPIIYFAPEVAKISPDMDNLITDDLTIWKKLWPITVDCFWYNEDFIYLSFNLQWNVITTKLSSIDWVLTWDMDRTGGCNRARPGWMVDSGHMSDEALWTRGQWLGDGSLATFPLWDQLGRRGPYKVVYTAAWPTGLFIHYNENYSFERSKKQQNRKPHYHISMNCFSWVPQLK